MTYAVYEIWGTTASVTGGMVYSRHSTQVEADAAAAACNAERPRQRPAMSRSDLAEAIKPYTPGTAEYADAKSRLTSRHAIAYAVIQIDDAGVPLPGESDRVIAAARAAAVSAN